MPGGRSGEEGGVRRLNGVAWAIDRWTRVTQKQKTRAQVKAGKI